MGTYAKCLCCSSEPLHGAVQAVQQPPRRLDTCAAADRDWQQLRAAATVFKGEDAPCPEHSLPLWKRCISHY